MLVLLVYSNPSLLYSPVHDAQAVLLDSDCILQSDGSHILGPGFPGVSGTIGAVSLQVFLSPGHGGMTSE